VDLVTIGFFIMVGCTVVWPMLTYAADAARFLYWKLKGVRRGT
jgi:hypothetical protein